MANLEVTGHKSGRRYSVPVDKIKGVHIVKTGVILVLTEKTVLDDSYNELGHANEYDAVYTKETHEELEEQYQRLMA